MLADRHEPPDFIVLDLKMPGMSGLDALFQAKVVKPEVEIIILTGHGSEEDKKMHEAGSLCILTAAD